MECHICRATFLEICEIKEAGIVVHAWKLRGEVCETLREKCNVTVRICTDQPCLEMITRTDIY